MTAATLAAAALVGSIGLVFGIGAAGLAAMAAGFAFAAGVMAERSDHADR